MYIELDGLWIEWKIEVKTITSISPEKFLFYQYRDWENVE